MNPIAWMVSLVSLLCAMRLSRCPRLPWGPETGGWAREIRERYAGRVARPGFFSEIRLSFLGLLPRKEVIQPHVPERLPCYDVTPLAPPTFDASLSHELGRRLRVKTTRVV